MTSHELVELVNDFSAWKGNTFTLAMLIMQKQKADDAALAEQHSQEAADAIRGQ